MNDIPDATTVAFFRERLRKAGGLLDGWEENSNRLQQKDLGASSMKKNGINHYGCKNSICIDAEHGFIRRFAVTSASVHDS